MTISSCDLPFKSDNVSIASCEITRGFAWDLHLATGGTPQLVSWTHHITYQATLHQAQQAAFLRCCHPHRALRAVPGDLGVDHLKRCDPNLDRLLWWMNDRYV